MADQTCLRASDGPSNAAAETAITVVDLFAGCGGMTLGLHEAARELGCGLTVKLAADSDPNVLAIYARNFPLAVAEVADVCRLFDGVLGAPLTSNERRIGARIRPVHVLLGGPPCQGHSDLNNHTRRMDPKNALFSRMARAAEVLRPLVVVAENVAAVQRDRGGVVGSARDALIASGYDVGADVLDLRRVGVPQSRKRFVMIATRLARLAPERLLGELRSLMAGHPERSVRWAIGDLMGVGRSSVYDSPSRCSTASAKRIRILFEKRLFDLPNRYRPICHRDGNHSYVSMYGRLRWNRAAHTVTTGFGSMGQGRYVHPQQHRTLTPHEAARLQTFPDWFDFGIETPRGVLATAIGNAVPPFLTRELGRRILPLVLANTDEEVSTAKRSA